MYRQTPLNLNLIFQAPYKNNWGSPKRNRFFIHGQPWTFLEIHGYASVAMDICDIHGEAMDGQGVRVVY